MGINNTNIMRLTQFNLAHFKVLMNNDFYFQDTLNNYLKLIIRLFLFIKWVTCNCCLCQWVLVHLQHIWPPVPVIPPLEPAVSHLQALLILFFYLASQTPKKKKAFENKNSSIKMNHSDSKKLFQRILITVIE